MHAKIVLVTGDVSFDEVGLQRQLRIDDAYPCSATRLPQHDAFKYNAIGVSRPLWWAHIRD
jgi:hypothetical protein